MAVSLGVLHKEIEDVRSRLLMQQWDVVTFDVTQRLQALQKFIGSQAGDELHRHVVVSSIAALETFHRGTIVSITDLSDEYKVRAAGSISEKFTMKDALGWFNGSTVTFGELVAHSASCNGTTDLISWLGILLACDVKSELAKSIDPYDRRNNKANPTPIVADVDILLGDIAEAFRLRHIYAHEAAPAMTIDASQCGKLHSAIMTWVKAVDGVLWATAYQHFPLTQYEMNVDAGNQVREERTKLAKAMRKALENARMAKSAGWLRRNHFAWSKVTRDWIDNTYGSLQGTMWPAVRGSILASAIKTRTQDILSWNKNQDT